MNTKFSYMYRDAANYKKFGEVVFKGEAQKCQPFLDVNSLSKYILTLCDTPDGNFIASQVRIPDLFLAPGEYELDEEIDHCYHELVGTPFELTDSCPSIDCTIAEFVGLFEKANKDGWKVFDPLDPIGFF